jgi:DNA (cytosine-5)-methyltransferase 1
MRYLSVCSGIEAATVAWHPLGWKAVAYSEIERFPSEVLAHHYPNTPNVGDMTKFKEWTNVSDVDLLVGGTPCQSFSVAGLRKGLDDPRGNLMLTYLAIARQYRPRWLVWENVPGVLSSNGGLDFASLLRGMGELGYGFAYRILDAQYFGVAQRRRRVFVVGYLGDWRAAAAVLFERHSLSGHPAPCREKREGIANSTRTGAQGCSHWDGDFPHPTLNQSSNCGGVGSSNQEIFSQRGAYLTPAMHSTVGALCADSHPGAYSGQDAYTGRLIPSPAFSLQGSGETSQSANGNGWNEEVSFTLNRLDVHGVVQLVYEMHGQDSRVRDLGDTCSTVTSKWGTGGGNVPVTMQTMAVRRLTCVECERLQGFPDNYTDIKNKNKQTPDGPRYKALGNSMAVPVMRWIGERIQKVEALNVS